MILPTIFIQFALVGATAAAAAPYFVPPPGWTVDYPTEEMVRAGMVAIWQPSKRNGENIALSRYSRAAGETLADAESELIREETQDGRDLVSTRHHATCHGTVDGGDVTLRFGSFAYQLYHLAIKGPHIYSIMYTHSATDRSVNPSVLRAIDSFCPP